jgi:hypothetical protein
MRRLAIWVVTAAVMFGGTGFVASPAVSADPPKKEAPSWRVDDPTLVYLGNPRLFKKPCLVSADRVYRSIPEYREILEKNLTDKDVRYHFLMKKASDKFSRAIKDLARDLSYDLVAGTGAVSPANKDTPAAPDETASAIARLPTA